MPRRVCQRLGDTPAASEPVGASLAGRPTSAEESEARDVIRVMKNMKPPLLGPKAPAKPNVVACAIALHRGERFPSEAEALSLFNVGSRTDVSGVWVDKLASFVARGGRLLPSTDVGSNYDGNMAAGTGATMSDEVGGNFQLRWNGRGHWSDEQRQGWWQRWQPQAEHSFDGRGFHAL